MKVDAVALVVGLACVAVAVVALMQHLGQMSATHLGIVAPMILIGIGVVGLLASRRNHNP